jgi:branched-chain amino acid transport system substrate-binding protein
VTAGPWKVGVLFSQTGVTASVELSQLNATLLAIEEINDAGGVLGQPLEPVVCDGASNPKQYRASADRLIAVDRVRLIFGCYMSSCRKAVLPAIESFRGALFYPTLYEGFEYSSQCVYTGASPNQNVFQLAKYLLARYGNRFLIVGSNYVFPYETNRIMTDFVVQSGGAVVDEIYVPLEAEPEHFAKTIRQIGKLKPDVVFSTVVGASTATFYEAYRRAGFDPAKTPIASLTTTEAEVQGMSREAAEGHISAAPFFETLGTPAARKFTAAFKRRFGPDAPVTAAAEAAYFQVHLAAGALARSGTDEPERLIAEVRDAEFDAPQGRVRVDADNNHTYLWPRVARLDAEGRFQIVWNPGVRVKPDPYCVAQSLDDWSAEAVQSALV